MSSKKITELNQSNSVSSDALLVCVTDPAGTPATVSISVNNFFGNVQPNTTFKSNVNITATLTSNILNIKEVYENVGTLSNANGTVTHNCSNSHIFVHNSPANNFTANLANLSLSNNATTVVLVINQGATPYIANAVHINGSSQTILWQNGSEPTATANKKDILSFSILKLSSTYTVLGQLSSFG
jgi:hypothetical protein